MQSLKEFVGYTKKTLSIQDTYALRENAACLGIGETALVEAAGFAIAEEIKRTHEVEDVTVVCGSGGKGAIGLATARHLLSRYDVNALFVGDSSKIKNESTRFNFDMLSEMIEVEQIGGAGAESMQKNIAGSELVIDALIGCGMRGRLSSLLISAIREINKSGRHIISVDIPSGIDGNTGMPNLAYVKANHTYCLHKIKSGLEKSKVVGEVSVIDIGIPFSAELLTGPGDIMLATEPRLIHSNKMSHGRVLILGGTEYRGAAMLAGFGASNALAALLVGVGYVTVCLPEAATEIARGKANAPIFVSADWDDVDRLVAEVSGIKHDVLVIGPGVDAKHRSAIAGLLKAESAAGKRIVIDAGAIKAVAAQKHLIGRNMVLTPHDGEFRALSGFNTKDANTNERIKKAISFAKKCGAIIVLKGNSTVITDGALLKVNKAKTPALSTMGTGDVLSGIIAAYAAVHRNLFEASSAGVYAHSRIGDLLYAQKGLHITADDLVASIPELLKRFDRIER